MNLEEELRAVLGQEAEMRTTPIPDIEAMVNGGETRLRRRNTMRMGLAAAAVLLVGGGIYGITQIGNGDPDSAPDIANTPTDTPSDSAPPSWASLDEQVEPVDPGTYRTYVGIDADSGSIEADMTLDGSNWRASNYPVAYDGDPFAGIGVYRPDVVGHGCQVGAAPKEAATEPQALAQQLAGMPRSTVLQEPSPTEAFGHAALHLRLRVNAVCDNGGAYQVADGPSGRRGISYFDEQPDGPAGMVIIDFWVVDMDGTTVVVDMFHTQDAPRTLVDQAARARESVTFVE